MMMKSVPFFISCAFVVSAFAQSPKPYTIDALFSTAMQHGAAEGLLVGPQADLLRQQTRSTAPTYAKAVRGEATFDGCQVFLMTLTQPDVPTTTSGKLAGDYVVTTKMTLCRDDRQPKLDVVGCSVAGKSCMPPDEPAR